MSGQAASAPHLVSGPHAHAAGGVSRIMLLVIAALTPATASGFAVFGYPAIFLFLITVVAAVGAEALCLRIAGRPVRRFLFDGSAVLTGWLVAMTLPPFAPWWIGALGGMIAIVLGKQVYGGLGQNLFNPAMVARVMLMISFPVQMTLFTRPAPLGAPGSPDIQESLAITFAGAPNADAYTSASWLSHVSMEVGRGAPMDAALSESWGLRDLAVGAVSGSMGETSALLIFLGGLGLIAARVISWRIPFAVLAAAGGLAALFHALDPAHYASAAHTLSSGALMLGAFFIATDYVTSPSTPLGQLLYGAMTGALIFVIRAWASFPEGVAFAVLIMNACTPLIDHFIRPRIFGRTLGGKPLGAPGDAA